MDSINYKSMSSGISRSIRITAILLAILTGIWIILLAVLMGRHGPAVSSFDGALRFVLEGGLLFHLTYLNVVVLTAVDVVLFSLLYLYFRDHDPAASLVGLIFVPVYAAYNLLVYISQVSFTRKLLLLYEDRLEGPMLEMTAGPLLQMWEHSAIAFLNNYAYAILGIPSVLFGRMMYRMNRRGRFAGLCLMLSGLASFIGLAGIIAGVEAMAGGSTVGGGLFLIALVGMAVLFNQSDHP